MLRRGRRLHPGHVRLGLVERLVDPRPIVRRGGDEACLRQSGIYAAAVHLTAPHRPLGGRKAD